MDLLPHSRSRWLDAALALGFAAVGCYEVLVQPLADDVIEGPTWLNVLAVLAGTLPLAWRRVAPMWVSLAMYGVLAGRALVAGPLEVYPTVLALLVATYTVASYAPLRDAVLSAVFSGLALSVAVVRGSGTDSAPDPLATAILFSTVWLVGRVVGVRNQRARELHEARDEHAATAVAAERERIAQEMHDSVSHSLAAIVMQAGGAANVLDNDPERARTGLAAIERSARQGLEEMRRSLGLLGESDAVRTPAPGMVAIPDLLEQVRSTGIDVRLLVQGEERPLGPQADAAAYRIVQESLTNVMKHAGPCRVEVRIGYEADGLDIAVVDDGLGGQLEGVGGRGLAGMKERAALLGGHLEAGPIERGFSVRARLPA